MIRGLGRVFRWYAKREARRAVLAESANEERIILGAVPETCREPLTEGERREYDRQWGWLGLPPSYREAEVFKHFNGFDARYLSHYHYLPLIARRLNDYRWTKRFEHKALLGFFSGEALRPPKTFACAIAGEWYDGDLRQIDFCEAVERCAGHDAFVCKPASESADGHGVRRIERGGAYTDAWKKTVSDALTRLPKDAVIQEAIQQSFEMARFNATSLNTLRVTTLYLNGCFSVCSIVLRMGKAGAFVDNRSAGGIMLGVARGGRLYKFGYDAANTSFERANGVCFAEEWLGCVPNLLHLLERVHTTRFSLCKFIGWDVAYDQADNPILIEINGSQPSVFGQQLCTGPIFGERTEEVIAYCRSKPFDYGRALGRF